MANYAEEADVKVKMGITAALSVDESTRVAFYLDATTLIINDILGDLRRSAKTETIKICDIIKGNEILVSNPQVVSLDEIGGESYTGVLNTDYMIVPPQSRKLIINDLNDFVDFSDFLYFTITYTAGFETIPKDLTYLQACLVEGELMKEGSQFVKSEKLGPRTIVFKDDQKTGSMINIIYSKYKPINI